jgi:hypothetical protein
MHLYSEPTQRRRGITYRLAVLLVVAALPSIGCGGSDRPTTIETSGIVTYKGAPVEGAQVMFTSPAARPATAMTDAEGRFELTTFATGDGAVEGKHRVTITKTERVSGADPNNPYADTRHMLPTKYSNPAKSPLSATIVDGGETDLKFALSQ